MKLIPFDLQRAIAGEPLITRDGKDVVWGAYNPKALDSQRICVWVGEFARLYYENGKMWSNEENTLDLFMKPKKVTMWKNWFKSLLDEKPFSTGKDYETREEAVNAGKEKRNFIDAFPTEIEL